MHNRTALFDSVIYDSNWKQQLDGDSKKFIASLVSFKNDAEFLFENAIRNDDSAKDKLAKINAQTYLLNKCCKRFIEVAKDNGETKLVLTILEE